MHWQRGNQFEREFGKGAKLPFDSRRARARTGNRAILEPLCAAIGYSPWVLPE